MIRETEKAIVQLLMSNGIAPVVTENTGFNAEHRTQPWYRVTSIPGIPTTPGVGHNGARRLVGIIQVDAFYLAGTGDNGAKESLDELADSIGVGSAVGEARVTNVARLSGNVQGKWYVVPFQITYRIDNYYGGN